MNPIRIPLRRNDVAELLYVERQSLSDSDYSVDEALQALNMPGQLCLGWYEGDALVGFLSCFETYTPAGARLELDMLGVLPGFRNRGIATALIRHAVEYAAANGLAEARAVVRCDNAASLTAFAKAGLARRECVSMLIWNQPATQSACPGHEVARTTAQVSGRPYLSGQVLTLAACGAVASKVTAIAVTTLAYRGCWLEDLEGPAVADRTRLATAAGVWAVGTGLDEAGMLVPLADTELITSLLEAGWHRSGDFHILGWQA